MSMALLPIKKTHCQMSFVKEELKSPIREGRYSGEFKENHEARPDRSQSWKKKFATLCDQTFTEVTKEKWSYVDKEQLLKTHEVAGISPGGR